MTTFSRPAEWETMLPATRGISHRSTTSSRRPGKAIEGSVAYDLAEISSCKDCGFMTRATGTGYPHGVRWTSRDGVHVKVDCVGREVPS